MPAEKICWRTAGKEGITHDGKRIVCSGDGGYAEGVRTVFRLLRRCGFACGEWAGTGCNVENASYGATMCAERTALFGAVSQGERRFAMLAVAGGKDGRLAGEFPPCGLCRQALVEFCPPEMPILVVTGEGAYKQYTLGELLPMPFGPAHV